MHFFLRIFYPIAAPLARILDHLTDDEEARQQDETYFRGELQPWFAFNRSERLQSSILFVKLGRENSRSSSEITHSNRHGRLSRQK